MCELKHIQHGAPAQSTRFVIPFIRRNSELPLAQSTRVLKALSCERKSLESWAKGGKYSKGDPWTSHVVVSGNLVTEQNPQSAEAFAQAVVKALA